MGDSEVPVPNAFPTLLPSEKAEPASLLPPQSTLYRRALLVGLHAPTHTEHVYLGKTVTNEE